MSDSKSLSIEQEKLIAAYLAGEDVNELLLLACKVDPDLLKEVSRYVANDRLLSAEFDSLYQSSHFTREVIARIDPLPQTSITQQVSRKLFEQEAANSWFNKPWVMAASIASFVCVLFISSFINNHADFAQVTKITATSVSDTELKLGNYFGRGDIELTQGFSEITLNNGVVLILEAPIKLNLKSSEQVVVHQGKLVARVPKNAIGFRIDTPSSEIIDLGTEFGVDVNKDGESQVHVINGEVKARANKSQRYKLVKKDQALAFNLKHEVASIKSESADFMRVLPGESMQNPDFLHWSFDNGSAAGFPSTGKGVNGKHYLAVDKSLSNTKTAKINGRFGQGLYFDGETNWLETDFAGIGSDHPRTVAFWLKVPSDFSTNKAYGIVSWGLHANYAAWQISPNPELIDGPLGRLRVGTYKAQVVGTTDLRDDQWHHIAVVVYGGENSNISTHVLLYVDGKLEKTQQKSIAKLNTQLQDPLSSPLSIGRNIAHSKGIEPLKQGFFKGGVDELFVYEAALEQQQIQQLMEKNTLLNPAN
ncbi:FecR domain-containing protein [Psychrosphaera sp. B3R10]|uniref:LamG-like jellyroll fold domain-containing protein n=1 Tax=unclassified Psychrosphaera TaxID=2641570 RepID=UPI001C084171|nr:MULTISPECIES: LamG-like jellyroll fold domain-containing protein [unclassified Psychrosphaera]MBU2881658.1 FecR domain-containing protein [Psychrosphaera sp. I2R16]MBU2991087.1 FecR domain-containing protein [Psychrosphaera sp. B3R10]